MTAQARVKLDRSMSTYPRLLTIPSTEGRPMAASSKNPITIEALSIDEHLSPFPKGELFFREAEAVSRLMTETTIPKRPHSRPSTVVLPATHEVEEETA